MLIVLSANTVVPLVENKHICTLWKDKYHDWQQGTPRLTSPSFRKWGDGSFSGGKLAGAWRWALTST